MTQYKITVTTNNDQRIFYTKKYPYSMDGSISLEVYDVNRKKKVVVLNLAAIPILEIEEVEG